MRKDSIYFSFLLKRPKFHKGFRVRVRVSFRIQVRYRKDPYMTLTDTGGAVLTLML